jgi:hypothetical protein
MSDIKDFSSFRDPSGFLFKRDGLLYRQINHSYQPHYRQLRESGLYKRLVNDGLLIPHEEADVPLADPRIGSLVIRPEPIEFISYPYEWCFGELKDAALATLAIQKLALEHNMTLKDASAYNIQFRNAKPILIDTLSFEPYTEGKPWVAYRQFCQHFLAPLALMAYRAIRLSQLLRIYMDGVPLDLASKLLPYRTRFKLPLYLHIHLHARMQATYAEGRKANGKKQSGMSRLGLRGLMDNLKAAIQHMTWNPRGTEWADYYENTNYEEEAFRGKERLVDKFIGLTSPGSIWDLGANIGRFSRLGAARGIPTIAFDYDPAAVEKNYLDCRSQKQEKILPLVMDLTNPSAGIGWANQERMPLLARGPADLVMALALIHHLAISNNVPLDNLARFFWLAGKALIIEFVPKSDSQVLRLLTTREDIFSEYTQEAFERVFAGYFSIEASEKLVGSERVLYLMRRKESAVPM